MRRRTLALLALLPLLAPVMAYAVATLTVSPTSFSYESRCVFTSADPRTVTVRNTDDESAALNVRVEVSPSSAAEVFPLSGSTLRPSLGPGDDLDFGVGFRPDSAGVASARAIVRYDAVVPPKKTPRPSPSGSPGPSASPSATPTADPTPSTTPRRVTVSVQGRGIERFASASPAFLNFGPLRVGRRAPTETISIIDDGATPLNITRIALAGRDAGDFTLRATAPVTIREGAPTSVQVGFRPLDVGGKIAALLVESDSCAGSLEVPLAGIGVQPDVVSAPLEMDFGVARPGEAKRDFLDVINQGGFELTVDAMEIEGEDASAFEFRRLPRFPHELPPGEKIEARVTMLADEPGELSAKVVITTNDPDDNGMWEVPLSGEVVAPSASPSPSPTVTAAPPPPPDDGFDFRIGAYVPEIAVGAAVVAFFGLLMMIRRVRGIPE